VLELAAEAVEVSAVARLCEWLVGAGWDDTAVDGRVVAEAPPSADGAQVVAVRSGSGLTSSGVPRAVSWSCRHGRRST
jgi:hypothetical protein